MRLRGITERFSGDCQLVSGVLNRFNMACHPKAGGGGLFLTKDACMLGLP